MNTTRHTDLIKVAEQIDAQFKHHEDAGLNLRIVSIESPIRKGDITVTYKDNNTTSLYQQIYRADGSWSELFDHPDQI